MTSGGRTEKAPQFDGQRVELADLERHVAASEPAGTSGQLA